MTHPQIAIVTGAGRGLGYATALALAEHGYRVVAAARDTETAQAVVRRIVDAGGEALALGMDVGDPQSIVEACAELLPAMAETWPGSLIGVLVNNAGVGRFAPLGDVSVADFDETFAVNVRGPFFMIQAFAPHLSDGACIVNLSSSLSRHVSPATAVYAASKAAVAALSRSLALELGQRGIRINTIAPGPTATDFNGGAMRDNAELRHGLAQQTALGRVGEPSEIADAVIALVSPGMRWVTGERTVAVFGATGQTGRRIVERLAQQGDDVLAIGRRADGGNGHPSVRSAVADLTRSSVIELEHLLEGVDAVVFAAAGDPIRVDRDGALRVIEAAERARVRRFVLITGMGVGRARPSEFSGGFWETYFGAKEVSEQRLRAGSLLWTILQPGELLNSVGAGTVQLAPTGTLPIGRVSRDDVAGVVVAVLERDQFEGHTWELVEGRDTIDDAVDEALRG